MSERRNIVLAGFMGTGKTTVGRLVAHRLGWTFVDTDDLIVAAAGCPVADIFVQQGEAVFRHLEREACLHMAAQPQHVIATGGGALLDPTTRTAFETGGVVIGLHCALDEILRRVGDDPSRPLFSAEREALAALLAARAPVYDSLPYRVDTSGRSPGDVAEEVIQLWQSGV
jgi:shikimate kinase